MLRYGAIVRMNVEDYYPHCKRSWLRLHEKGGKLHDVPAHHNVAEYLDAYIASAGIGDERGTPLWRAMTKERRFGEHRMNRVDVWAAFWHGSEAGEVILVTPSAPEPSGWTLHGRDVRLSEGP